LRRISFDPIAQVFDKTRGPPEHVRKQLLDVLANELIGYKTILDAGVGTGRFAKPLQDKEFEVVGIDLSQKMLSVAQEKGRMNLFRGDICFLPFKTRSFDVAICNAVLHLIAEWETALHEICRVTSSVIVSTIHEQENPVRKAYGRLLEKYGYESTRRGKPEYNLKVLVTPLRFIHVASYYVKAEDSLAHMSQRVYSHQWEIPENVNNEIMKELTKRFSGRKFPQELSILVWNVDDLRAYLRKRRH